MRIKSYLINFFFFFSSVSVTASSTQKPMVIVVPSYNNSVWVLKNLDSIFNQNYENYRVIYIDDCSIDHTYHLVCSYVAQNKLQDRITVIKNKQHMGALYNHYRAVHTCQNHEIIIQLDGDDWLKHEQVLQIINKAYEDTKVWLTYGQYETFPEVKKGNGTFIHRQTIEENNYREYVWVSTALRTFYAGLFKQIKLEDFLYNGLFFQTACDLAFMFPMLEMSHGNFKFLNETVYVYNHTQFNDFKINRESQLLFDKIIRKKQRYTKIAQEPYQEIKNTAKSDLLLICKNRENLEKIVSIINTNLSGIGKIIVIPHDDHVIFNEKNYPKLSIEVLNNKKNSFKDTLINAFSLSNQKYLLLAHDECIPEKYIDIQLCVDLMEKTQAYCFLLSLGKDTYFQKQPVLNEIENDVFCWQFIRSEGTWLNVHTFEYSLFEKNEIEQLLLTTHFKNFTELLEQLENQIVDMNKVGLCFARSKVTSKDY